MVKLADSAAACGMLAMLVTALWPWGRAPRPPRAQAVQHRSDSSHQCGLPCDAVLPRKLMSAGTRAVQGHVDGHH